MQPQTKLEKHGLPKTDSNMSAQLITRVLCRNMRSPYWTDGYLLCELNNYHVWFSVETRVGPGCITYTSSLSHSLLGGKCHATSSLPGWLEYTYSIWFTCSVLPAWLHSLIDGRRLPLRKLGDEIEACGAWQRNLWHESAASASGCCLRW